jgi:Fe-S-cluster containining protein
VGRARWGGVPPRPPTLPLEAAELRGKSFTCLEGCAFCCLCQPGLDAHEQARFRGPLAGAVEPGGDALRIVGQAGPCALLSPERGCMAYDLRPRGCRSFPFHTTMGWRVQVNLNRGCPGTWSPGAPPAAQSFDPSEALPPGGEAAAAAADALAAWQKFEQHARAAGVYMAPGEVQRRLQECVPLLRDESGLAAGLALAESGLEVDAANLRRGVGKVAAAPLGEFLEQQARATFAQDDPKRLPILVDADEGFRWLAFRLRGDALEACTIGPDGALAPGPRLPLLPLPLLARDAAAMVLWDEHAAVLARRDLLVSLAAYMLDRLDYGEPLASAALRELVAALGDLWLRAGVLAALRGARTIDASAMRRGIAFFDMDFLNAPSIGASF